MPTHYIDSCDPKLWFDGINQVSYTLLVSWTGCTCFIVNGKATTLPLDHPAIIDVQNSYLNRILEVSNEKAKA